MEQPFKLRRTPYDLRTERMDRLGTPYFVKGAPLREHDDEEEVINAVFIEAQKILHNRDKAARHRILNAVAQRLDQSSFGG